LKGWFTPESGVLMVISDPFFYIESQRLRRQASFLHEHRITCGSVACPR
jgi:hypothetical protein